VVGLWCYLENEYAKWFPDIQLRLLDVGFPTFNITFYCTSGSRRVDTAMIQKAFNLKLQSQQRQRSWNLEAPVAVARWQH